MLIKFTSTPLSHIFDSVDIILDIDKSIFLLNFFIKIITNLKLDFEFFNYYKIKVVDFMEIFK